LLAAKAGGKTVRNMAKLMMPRIRKA